MKNKILTIIGMLIGLMMVMTSIAFAECPSCGEQVLSRSESSHTCPSCKLTQSHDFLYQTATTHYCRWCGYVTSHSYTLATSVGEAGHKINACRCGATTTASVVSHTFSETTDSIGTKYTCNICKYYYYKGNALSTFSSSYCILNNTSSSAMSVTIKVYSPTATSSQAGSLVTYNDSIPAGRKRTYFYYLTSSSDVSGYSMSPIGVLGYRDDSSTTGTVLIMVSPRQQQYSLIRTTQKFTVYAGSTTGTWATMPTSGTAISLNAGERVTQNTYLYGSQHSGATSSNQHIAISGATRTANTHAYATGAAVLEINQLANTLTVAPKTLTYTGSAQQLVTVSNPQGTMYYSTTTELTASNYTSGSTTIPSGTNVGSYTVYYYTPGNINYKAIGGSVSTTIARKSISKPTASNKTYNGSSQTGVSSGTGYTLSGTYSATNAGSYTATATLSSNYIWSDGSVSPASISWSIAKKAPTLTFSGNTSTTCGSSTTKTYSYNGDGTITVTTGSSSVATASVNTSTKTVTITGKGAGSTSVTVSAAAGTNYSAASASISVTVSHSYSSKVTTAATCTTAGVRTYTCSCGASYTESIAATGHTESGTWSTDASQHWKVCTVCSGIAVSKANHADNNSDGKCDTCGYVMMRTPTMTVSQSSVTCNVGASATNITYTYSGNGTVSVSSSSTSVATATVNTSTKTITITPGSAGSATVTLKAAATSTYYAIEKTITVTVGSAPTVSYSHISTNNIGWEGWTLTGGATINSSNELVLTADGQGAYKMFLVDEKRWTIDLESIATATSSKMEVHMGSGYEDANFNSIVSQNSYTGNGWTGTVNTSTWTKHSWTGYEGYGEGVKYVRISINYYATYNSSPLKVRNVKFSSEMNENYVGAKINASVSSGSISSVKYLWSTASSGVTASQVTNSTTNGSVVYPTYGVKGTYYLWVLVNDSNGGQALQRSEAYTIDNPEIELVESSGTGSSKVINAFVFNQGIRGPYYIGPGTRGPNLNDSYTSGPTAQMTTTTSDYYGSTKYILTKTGTNQQWHGSQPTVSALGGTAAGTYVMVSSNYKTTAPAGQTAFEYNSIFKSDWSASYSGQKTVAADISIIADGNEHHVFDLLQTGVAITDSAAIVGSGMPNWGYTTNTGSMTVDGVQLFVFTNFNDGIAEKRYALGALDIPTMRTSGTTFTGNSFAVNKNGTYTVYTRTTNGVERVRTINVTGVVDKAAPEVTITNNGSALTSDPTFKTGNNGISVYNNLYNGNVTITRQQNGTAPNDSGYSLHIKTTGSAEPTLGGFYFANSTAANEVIVTKIVAKIPTGYTLNWHSNSIGSGGSGQRWLTSQAGTGDWATYISYVKTGSTGSFSTTNFFALSGTAATASSPVEWDVAYANVYKASLIDWTNANITVTGNALDSVSGTVAYAFTTTDTTPTSWTTVSNSKSTVTGTYSATGNGTVFFWAKDANGNISKTATYIERIDKNAPTIGSITTPYAYVNTASGGTISVTASGFADTGGSGITHFRYAYIRRNTDSSWIIGPWETQTSSTRTYTIPVTVEDTYSIEAQIMDGAGNVSGWPQVSLVVDRTAPTAPTITAKLNNSSGATYTSGNWTNQNVWVALTSTDSLSGVAKYQWKSDSNTSWTDLNGNEITFDIDRNETVYFRAIDNATNISSESSIIIRRDATLPTVIANVDNGNDGNWTTGDISINVTGKDSLSGVSSIQYSTNNSTWTTIDTATSNNILRNSDFSSAYAANFNWDTSLNEGTVASYWSEGYNAGVPEPTIGYHAHINTTDFDFNTLKFVNKNSAYGHPGRWLGLAQSFSVGKIKAGTTYTISYDVYSDAVGRVTSSGLYYSLTDGTGNDFHNGLKAFGTTANEVGKWVRRTYTFTTTSSLNTSGTVWFYIYGESGTEGTSWVKNIQLEEGSTATNWTANTDDQTNYEKDGLVKVSSSFNGTYYFRSIDNAGNISAVTSKTIKKDGGAPEVTITNNGSALTSDPTFKTGNNGISVYNNLGNGTVTLTRVQDGTAPNDSGYALHIKTNGEANPNLGGFTFYTQSAANEVYITKIVAKIPVGCNIDWHSNRIGDGAYQRWLTSTAGTGDWATYIYFVRTGSSGEFWTTNFFALSGSTATEAAPVEWDVAYANVYKASLIDWTNANITVTGNALDTTTGTVAYAFTTTDTTPTSWTTVSSTTSTVTGTYSATGNGTVFFWAKDANGNISKTATYIERIDKEAPVITNTWKNPNGWTNGSTGLYFSATDNASGISGYATSIWGAEYCTGFVNITPSTAVSSQKFDELTYNRTSSFLRIKDQAGNTAETAVPVLNFDKTAPILIDGSTHTAQEYYNNAIKGVALDATETFPADVASYNGGIPSIATVNDGTINSNEVLKITHASGTTTSGYARTHFYDVSKVYVRKIMAKIPKGYTLVITGNAVEGNVYDPVKFDSFVGTGEWKEYAAVYFCSDNTANNMNFGHLFIEGAAATSAFDWYVASDITYDVTNVFDNVNVTYSGANAVMNITSKDTQSGTASITVNNVTQTLTTLGVNANTSYTVSAAGNYAIKATDAVGNSTTLNKTAYAITYDGNGATSGTMEAEVKIEGVARSISENRYTRPGYRFTGWNTAADGSGTNYAVGSEYSEDANITIYAQWTKNTFTATLDQTEFYYDGTEKKPTATVKYGDKTLTASGKNILEENVSADSNAVKSGNTWIFDSSETNTTANAIKVQLWNNSSYVSQIGWYTEVGQKFVTITKDSTFNGIRFSLNGSEQDNSIYLSLPHLMDGYAYTFSFNIDVLRNLYAEVSNLQLELGSAATAYEEPNLQDYYIAYKDNVEVGTATATIVGVGDYVGYSLDKNFTIKESNYKVNGNLYTTLKDAVDSITTSEQTTIEVLRDVTDNTNVTIAANKNIKVDLKGKTITIDNIAQSGNYIDNSGNLELLDSVGGGVINMTVEPNVKYANAFIFNQGSANVTITSGTYNVYIHQGWQSAIRQVSTGTVTINGGSIYSECNGTVDCWATGIFVMKGKVIMNGGNITAKTTSKSASGIADPNQSGGSIEIEINGGTIEAITESGLASPITLGSTNTTTTIGKNDGTINTDAPVLKGNIGIEINASALDIDHKVNFYDGIFYYKDAFISDDITIDFGLPTGYVVDTGTDGDYKTAYLALGNYSVGDKFFLTLEEAYEATTETERTIVVERDNNDSSTFEVEEGKTITLDTNGKTIRKTGSTLTNNGTLTIIGSGTITTVDVIHLITNTGTLNLEHSGTLSQTSTYNAYAVVRDSGNVNVTGTGEIISSTYAGIHQLDESTGKMKISSGTISGRYGVIFRGSTLDVTGGRIEGTISYGISNRATGTANITGGIIIGAGYGVGNNSTGTVNITGGTVTGNTYGVNNVSTGTVIIGNNDGTVSTTVPEIIGNEYGYYGAVEGGTLNFNDGIFKGTTAIGGADGVTVIPNVPEGYALTKGIEGDYETAYLTIGNYRVGNKYFVTLKEAYEAIEETSGTIIAVEENITDSSSFTVANGKTITIDTNGMIITKTTSSITIDEGGTLIIDGTGTITSALEHTIVNNGTLTVNNGTLEVNGNTSWRHRVIATGTGSMTTINGGLIRGINTEQQSEWFAEGIGGTGSIEITAGVITASGFHATGIDVHDESSYYDANIKISGNPIITATAIGGEAKGVSMRGSSNTGERIVNVNTEISGGTITAIGTNGGYGYGLRSFDNDGTITITGGTLTGPKAIYTGVNQGTLTIGNSANPLDKTAPIIVSEASASLIPAGFNFSSGLLKLKGEGTMYEGEAIVPTGYAIVNGTDGDYKTAHLKKTSTITVLDASVKAGETIEVSYEYNGDGEVSAEIETTGAATIESIDEEYKTITIRGINVGSAEVTVTAAEGTEYAKTSTTFTVTVLDSDISITANPIDVKIKHGNEVSFSVTANGTNLDYQWYRALSREEEGTLIEGATEAIYTIPAISMTKELNETYYYCIVSNSLNTETSESARLTVYYEPTIITQPVSQTVVEGDSVIFSVATTNGNPVETTYQWQVSKDDGNSWTNIVGETGVRYSTEATLDINGYVYRVLVGNAEYVNSVVSDSATLTVEESVMSLSFVFGTNGSTGYVVNANTTVTVVDTSGEDTLDPTSLKFVWTQSTEEPLESEFVNTFDNGAKIEKSATNGTWYLWALAKDVNGKKLIKRTEAFYVDTIAPSGIINIIATHKNKNEEKFVDSNTVSISLTANDNLSEKSNIQVMFINEENHNNLTWTTYESSKSWETSAGEGWKEVFVIFKDEAGNQSAYIL